MLSDEQIRLILCAAINNPLLILTVGEKTADEIYEDIYAHLKSRGLGVIMSSVKKRYNIFFNGGYENIMVMPIKWWTAHNKLLFHGSVYVTNKAITDIPNITVQPLPITILFGDGEQK